MSRDRILVITRRIIAGFRRDHRTLALLFVVPVVVSALLGWIVTSSTTDAPRLMVAIADDALRAPIEGALRALDDDDLVFVGVPADEADGRRLLTDDAADVLLVVPSGTMATILGGGSPELVIVTAGLDPVGEGGSVARVGQALVRVFGSLAGRAVPLPTITHDTVYGTPDADQIDTLGPVYLAFIAYFFVFILTGVSFLRERVSGTLERLLASPVRRSEIILGYSVGFGLFAALQVIILLTFALSSVRTPAIGPLPELQIGLGVASAGSPIIVFAVIVLLAIGSVNLGILLSTFARTEFQVLQFIPLVIVPQGLLAGLLWPVESLPGELEALSRVMPMRYGIDGLRAVMVRGAGLDDPALLLDLAILAGLALGFVVLAGRTVRREVA